MPEEQNSDDIFPQIFWHPEFILGAVAAKQFPNDDCPEVAFAGRSNVGKSSAINAICRRRKLARTSKTPGRTQEINFFSLGTNARLVDLPGYGFAQVPLKVKEKWQNNIQNYLSQRDNLIVLILLMDIRHPLTTLDQQMLDWASAAKLPTQILLTKADKLKPAKVRVVCSQVEKKIQQLDGQFEVEPFSIHNSKSIDVVRKQMAEWLKTD